MWSPRPSEIEFALRLGPSSYVFPTARLSMAVPSSRWVSGILWPEPVVINSGPLNGPPSDAIVLFNGTDVSQWENGETWTVQDGYASPRSGDIRTKTVLDDCQ